MTDPYEAGPPEYQPDEDPGDDTADLFAEAAAEWEDWGDIAVWRPHDG